MYRVLDFFGVDKYSGVALLCGWSIFDYGKLHFSAAQGNFFSPGFFRSLNSAINIR
jgi:hypothetical protein